MLFINNLLLDMELDSRLVVYLANVIKVILIGLFCIVANFISKKIVIRIITRIVKTPRSSGVTLFWNDKFFESYPILFLRLLSIRLSILSNL